MTGELKQAKSTYLFNNKWKQRVTVCPMQIDQRQVPSNLWDSIMLEIYTGRT